MEEGDLVKLNCFKNGKDEAIGISPNHPIRAPQIRNPEPKTIGLAHINSPLRVDIKTRSVFNERELHKGMPLQFLVTDNAFERLNLV